MLSHVMEFSCQYSDQVRKKQKVWHDGKLKYFQINNKFMLYSEDNVMLSSSFVTNTKEIQTYLDEEGFEITEHRIFGSFVVVINEVIAEYDREIQHIKTTTATSFTNSKDFYQSVNNNASMNHVKHQDKMILKSTTENHPSSKNVSNKPIAKKAPVNVTKLNSMNSLVKKEKSSGGMTSSGLALKFNKPFKPPRMANSSNMTNRPTIRNALVKQEVKQNILNSSDTNKANFTDTDELLISNNPPLKPRNQEIIPKKEPKNNFPLEPTDKIISHDKPIHNLTKQSGRILFKPRVITHKPIILP